MEVICSSSETSVDFQRTAWHYVPEDATLHNPHWENLKSYNLKLCITREIAHGNETVDLLIREITYYDSRLNVFPFTVFLLFTTMVLHNASFVNLMAFKQWHMSPFCAIMLVNNIFFFFFRFSNLFAICRDTFSKWCVGKRGRVEECSLAPLRNKRVKTLCGCQEKRIQLRKNTN
jgi:hypothetical protein